MVCSGGRVEHNGSSSGGGDGDGGGVVCEKRKETISPGQGILSDDLNQEMEER